MRFWIEDDSRRLKPDQVRRIFQVLEFLDEAAKPEDMSLPGLRFHRLRGKPVRYSVTVTELSSSGPVRKSQRWGSARNFSA